MIDLPCCKTWETNDLLFPFRPIYLNINHVDEKEIPHQLCCHAALLFEIRLDSVGTSQEDSSQRLQKR